MFPLEFPLSILRRIPRDAVVADVFCGRGTTNFAAQVRGMVSYGIDSSPVAVAIAKAKLASATPNRVINLAERYLERIDDCEIPRGKFWTWAYHPSTLRQICKIRKGLLESPDSGTVVILRALMLGALHGPLPKNVTDSSYFSNQMPRTFASKPDYSVKYWRKRKMTPPKIDVLKPLRRRAEAALATTYESDAKPTYILHGNSEDRAIFHRIRRKIDYVVTSPPYYGLRTYLEDQWLRNWFLGGKPDVPYAKQVQLNHHSPDEFAQSLANVWDNVAAAANDGLRMAVRFGSIRSRKNDPTEILKQSFKQSSADWKLERCRPVGTATKGKRQAKQMGALTVPLMEYDYFIRLL